MTCGRETSNVKCISKGPSCAKRISSFVREARDLRKKRDERDGRRFEIRSAKFFELRTRNIELPVSFTFHETRTQRQAGC
jgi:hypothetical protein